MTTKSAHSFPNQKSYYNLHEVEKSSQADYESTLSKFLV